MKKQFNHLIKYLIQLYQSNDEKQIRFPKVIILILRIQQSLLSLSYIYGRNMNSYNGLLSMFARPQLFLPKTNAIQFIIFFLCLLYITNKVKPQHFHQQINIFGQLLYSAMLNFFFEYSTGIFQIATHIMLIIISFSENIILQGTLNAQTINFQITRMTLYDLVLLIINYIVMVLYSYQIQNDLIKILALVYIIIKIINQIQNSPLKDLETQSILMSIYFYTFIFGIIQLSNEFGNINIELIIFPIIFRIIQKTYINKFKQLYACDNKQKYQINEVLLYLHNITNLQAIKIQEPIQPRDKIIFSSLLILQNLHYRAYKELIAISQNQLNLLEQFKIQVIIRQCLQAIENKISYNQNLEYNTTLAASNLINSEQQNQAVLNDILLVLREKSENLNLLTQQQTISHFYQYQILIQKIMDLKNRLESYYSESASMKTQNILGFFYVEVINDYLAASMLYSVMQISDDKIKRINQLQDHQSINVSFIICSFQDNLIIQKVSNEIPNILKHQADFFKDKLMNIFVPPGIAQVHDELVLSFLMTGQSKYLRHLDLNYLFVEPDNQMIDIEFAVELNFQTDLTFIAFIQIIDRKSMALVLNDDNIVTCLSDGILANLESKFRITKWLGKNIRTILLGYPVDIQNNSTIENAEINLQKINQQFSNEFSNTLYITTYKVHQKTLNDKIIYSIITFDFFKKANGFLQSISQLFPQKQSIQQILNFEGFKEINQESQIFIPYLEPSNKKIPFSIQNNLNEKCDLIEQKGLDELQNLVIDYNQNLMSPCCEIELLIEQKRKFNKESQGQLNRVYQKYQDSRGEISIAEENQQQDQYSQEKIIIYQDNQSSQVSSLMGVRRSKYYKRYEIIQKMLQQNLFKKKQRNYITLLVLCIVFQILLQLIQLVSINLSFVSLISDIDLLQIKNFLFQPLEAFLVTRYTIVNYSQQRDAKTITLAQFNELVKFPRSNLALGYDQLAYNLKQLIYRPELLQFLEENYLDIFMYTTSGVGEKFNMTLRNSIDILKNYQYTFKMAYVIDGVAYADSPYAYYQYKNYLPQKQLFSELNQQILQESILRSQKMHNQLIIIFSLSCAILFLFICLIPYAYYQIIKKKFRIFSMMYNISELYIEDDRKRYHFLIEKIQRDPNIIYKYQFSLAEKEKSLDHSQQNVFKTYRSKLQPYCFYTQDFNYHFAFIVCILLIFGNSLITFLEGQNYLAKYPETANFYKELSDVGTDLPTMYAQRDVLYGRSNLKIYSEQECQELLDQVKQAVNRTALFLDKSIDFNNYIATIEFENYFKSIENSNLCDFIPENLQQQALSICELVMNQNLKRGLKVTLGYMINFIKTDMEINQFVKKTGSSYFELEGAFIVSNIIQSVNLEFNHDLLKQTRLNNQSINIHNILILLLLFFEIIIILTFLKIKLQFRLNVVQHFVYILPAKIIFLDNYFERNLRHLQKIYK